MSETMEQETAKFHAHLDVCRRCASQPFNLCGTGARLLQDAATEDNREAAQTTRNLLDLMASLRESLASRATPPESGRPNE